MLVQGREFELEVRVTVSFMGWHSLPMRPELHLHQWDLEFSVSGPLNPETGMVCDMLELADFFKPFVNELDGTNLHEFPGFRDQDGLLAVTARFPTCDTLVHYFMWRILPEFEAQPQFRNLRISQIKLSISEPDEPDAWGHAIIRPKL